MGQCDPLGLAMFGYFDSYSEYFSEVGQTYANIGLGAYQAVKGVGLGSIQLIDQTPTNLFQIGSSLAEMSQDPKLYLSAAYDLFDESHPISDAEQGLLSLGQQTADLWTSGDLAQQGQFVGGVLGNAALFAAPAAKLRAVGDIYATVRALDTAGAVPSVFYITPKGVAISSETLSLQGTSPLVGNFTGLKGATVDEIVSRIPSTWSSAPQARGQGLVWFNEAGEEALRIHAPGVNAPPGSNSALGWILRVNAPGGQYYDDLGNVVGRKADAGHIPIFGNANANP